MLYLAAIFNIVFEFKVIVEAFQKFAKSTYQCQNWITLLCRNNDWSLSIHSGSGPHCSRSCRSRRRPAPGAAPWPWPRPSPPSRSWTRTWRRWARRPATSTCAAGTGAHPWQPSGSRTRHTLWIELATNLRENFTVGPFSVIVKTCRGFVVSSICDAADLVQLQINIWFRHNPSLNR